MNQHIRRIGIGCDHAGYEYKEKIKTHLQAKGLDVVDFGTDSNQPVDYPGKIRPVAQAVASGTCDAGIVLGGSGNGEAIVANKVKGIRCAVCWNTDSARLGKQHNDANMISLGQRMIASDDLLPIVDVYLTAQFQAGRHARRIAQIETP